MTPHDPSTIGTEEPRIEAQLPCPTARDIRAAAGVHRLFEAQAARSPDAVAVEFRCETWTYRELNDLANSLAARLRSLGVQRETVVGVHVQRSPRMIAALLAVLKAGGAYLPLDPSYPETRLSFMLEDSQAAVLVVDDVLPAGLSQFAGRILQVDSVRPEESCPPSASAAVRSTDLAYIIYTSGSTGKPKGVLVEHGSMLNFLAAMHAEPGLAETDAVLMHSSLSFDIHVFDVFQPLIAGARTILVPQESVAHGPALRKLLVGRGATVMQGTPMTWRLLLEAGWSPEERLRVAMCGGEPMPRKLADELLERGDQVWNCYGPTEATVISAQHRVGPGSGNVPIGRAIDNTLLYVLDEQARPVPPGVAGELYIGGQGLARGYQNLPELTAQRFVADPFAKAAAARLYRSGDLVRLLPGGELDYLGRIDRQVKIRGYRIEPGEIESVLEEHPGVRAAVVEARDDRAGNKQLVAYYVPANSSGPAPAELVAALHTRLPAHMIPSAYVLLDELPLTPSGKIDRQALPAPQRRSDPSRLPCEPANDTESRLRRIWEEVLETAPVGVEDTFHELGGDSLASMRMLLSIEQEFGRSFFTSVLPETTVRSLARLLETASPATANSSLVLLRSGAGRPLFFHPGLGGIPMDLLEIGPHFQPGRAIYTLRAPGLEDDGPPLESVEKLAAHYLRHVREVQPHGPYLLAGWSFGASVAFEMARQLQSQGERVDYLGLVDEFAPRAYQGERLGFRDTAAVARKVAVWLLKQAVQRIKHMGVNGTLAQPDPSQWYKAIPQRRTGKRSPDPISRYLTSDELPVSLERVLEAHLKAAEAYEPGMFAGRAFVYRTEECARFKPDKADRGWQKYIAGEVVVRRVPGIHINVHKDPYAAVLAARMDEDMQAAERCTAACPDAT